MRKRYASVDRRLKRMFQEIWDSLIDDIIIQKLIHNLGSRSDLAGCGTAFKYCEMRASNPPYLNDCLSSTQAITLKAYLLMQKRGYTFFPIGCLRLNIGSAEKIKDVQWTENQKRLIERELYEKK